MRGIAIGFLLAALLAQGQQPVGSVHGVVLDPAGAVVVGMDIAVTSNEQSCRARSNDEGKFNCTVKPGKYSIVVTGEGRMPYRRAMIDVGPSSHLFLKLRPVLRGLPVGILTVGSVDQDAIRRAFPDPQLNYEEQSVAGADVLVQYASSIKKDGSISFSGPHLTLTADALSVYADELSCLDDFKTCTGKGSIRVEIGEQEFEGTAVDIHLSIRRFVLTRDSNVVRTY